MLGNGLTPGMMVAYEGKRCVVTKLGDTKLFIGIRNNYDGMPRSAFAILVEDRKSYETLRDEHQWDYYLFRGMSRTHKDVATQRQVMSWLHYRKLKGFAPGRAILLADILNDPLVDQPAMAFRAPAPTPRPSASMEFTGTSTGAIQEVLRAMSTFESTARFTATSRWPVAFYGLPPGGIISGGSNGNGR